MGSLLLHRMLLRRNNRVLTIIINNHFKLSDYDPRAATIELIPQEIYRYCAEGHRQTRYRYGQTEMNIIGYRYGFFRERV